MFRTDTEIREAARKKVRDQIHREEQERIRSGLEAHGVVITPELAEEVFDLTNGEEPRKKRWFRFFRR